MKKLVSFFILFSLITLNACSSNEEKSSSENKAKEYKEGVVNQMNGDMFKTMIWDYQKNPEQWVFNGDLPCIIDFYADWCRPCRLVSPIMEELAGEYKGRIRIFKVNTDHEKELASMFRINSIPAVMLIPKNGQPQMAVGAQPKDAYLKAISDVLQVK
jgi:thioredoxin 1